MRSFGNFWRDTMQIPEARWIVYGAILICVLIVAVYVSFYFRNLAIGKNSEDESLDMLSDFRNLRDQGHLNETEYSRLKKVIPEHSKQETMRGHHPNDVSDSKEAVQNNEKQFMTLAESESRKQEGVLESELNEDIQARESD